MPGIDILVNDTAPPRSVPTSISTAFMVVIAERGPTDKAVRVTSYQQYVDTYGDRLNWTTGSDAVKQHFDQGGNAIWIIRKVSATATKATASTPSATPIFTWTAKSEGDWGNSLKPRVIAGTGAGTFKGVIARTINGSDVDVESSPEFATKADIANWFTTSSAYMSAAAGAGALGASPAVAATGGADNLAGMADGDRTRALGLFARSLGPGQVQAPGDTTQNAWAALAEHASNNNRFALWELPDTSDKAVLKAAVAFMRTRSITDQRHGMFVGGATPIVPGIASGARVVSYASAVASALMSRNDSLNISPNQAAAGIYGVVPRALDVSRSFSDADYDDLNASGVNIFRLERGEVRLSGFRTAADKGTNDLWWNAANARLLMYIVDGLSEIGDRYLWRMIDGGGIVIGNFNGEQVGFLQGIWQTGALFGLEPGDSFNVDTGAQVNTPASLNDGQLKSVVSLRMSPFPEDVTVTIVKKRITEEV